MTQSPNQILSSKGMRKLITTAAQNKKTRTIKLGSGGDFAFLQSAKRNRNLENRTRLKSRGVSPIDHGRTRILKISGHIINTFTGRKSIRVKGRRTEHGHHLGRGNVNHHKSSPSSAKNIIGNLLDALIDGQNDIGARRRIAQRQNPYLPATTVHLHLTSAGNTAQILVKTLLNPGVTDKSGNRVSVINQVFHSAGIHSGSITEQMGTNIPTWIPAFIIFQNNQTRMKKSSFRNQDRLLTVKSCKHRNRSIRRGTSACITTFQNSGFDTQCSGQELKNSLTPLGCAVLGNNRSIKSLATLR